MELPSASSNPVPVEAEPVPFSVMIPCHDPDLSMMEQTLCSVRSQLPPGVHQVCVIDDASKEPDAIKNMALRHACEYVRPEIELGGVMAHNLCLSLASHELIHLLHPDDWTLNGFYHHIEEMARLSPDRALYCTAAIVVRADGTPYAAASLEAMGFSPTAFLPLHHGNPLCVAACVTRKSFFLEHGGWHPDLYHTADWEYWVRATIKGGCAVHDWPLACWRVHQHNHTHRLARTGRNLQNFVRCGEVVSEYMPVDWRAFRLYIASRARGQAAQFRACGDMAGAAANEELALYLERQAA